MKLIQSFGGGGYRRIESEGNIGVAQIIINGFEHGYNWKAQIDEALSDPERSVVADNDKGIESEPVKLFNNLSGKVLQCNAVLRFHRIIEGVPFVGGAQNSAPYVSNTPHRVAVKMNEIIVLQHTSVAKNAAVNFPAPVDGRQYNCSNGRI